MSPFAIVIPARHASTRFPAKPLAPLRGVTGLAKPLIGRSVEAALAVPGAAAVLVATDDWSIAAAAREAGADVVMTPAECRNGTERVAAALHALPAVEVIVNLQGDAPLTPPWFVTAAVARLADDAGAAMATPVVRATPAIHRRLLNDAREGRVGGTTAAVSAASRALYFSKAVIPHVPPARLDEAGLPVFLHIGLYAYRRAALDAYMAAPVSVLEELEGLEQLRFLDAGLPVAAVEVDAQGRDIWELNNPEDTAPIEAALAALGIA